MKIKAEIIYVFSSFYQCHSFTLAVSLSQSARFLQRLSLLRCAIPPKLQLMHSGATDIESLHPRLYPIFDPSCEPINGHHQLRYHLTDYGVFTASLLSSRVNENTARTLCAKDARQFSGTAV